MSNSSAGTIITYIQNLLRTSGSTDLPALQESFLLVLISQANQEYLRAFRRGGGSEPLTSLLDTGFDLVSDTAINQVAGVAVTDVTFSVDNNSFPDSSGAAVFWDDNNPDPFYYTDRTSTSFSGVTNIGFAHEDNDPIQALYKLPASFSDFRPAEEYGDGVRLNGYGLRFMEGPPNAGYFSALDNGTSTFLWLPRGLTGSVSVLYEALPTPIDSTDDIVDVPQPFEFFLVWRSIQIACVPKGTASELYVLAKGEANKILNEALGDKNVGKYARVKPIRPLSNRIYDPSLFRSVPR